MVERNFYVRLVYTMFGPRSRCLVRLRKEDDETVVGVLVCLCVRFFVVVAGLGVWFCAAAVSSDCLGVLALLD